MNTVVTRRFPPGATPSPSLSSPSPSPPLGPAGKKKKAKKPRRALGRPVEQTGTAGGTTDSPSSSTPSSTPTPQGGALGLGNFIQREELVDEFYSGMQGLKGGKKKGKGGKKGGGGSDGGVEYEEFVEMAPLGSHKKKPARGLQPILVRKGKKGKKVGATGDGKEGQTGRTLCGCQGAYHQFINNVRYLFPSSVLSSPLFPHLNSVSTVAVSPVLWKERVRASFVPYRSSPVLPQPLLGMVKD